METTTRKTITICSIITLFIMGLYIIFLSRIIMLYLLLALILVIAINPLVVKIEKKKMTDEDNKKMQNHPIEL